MTRLAVCFFVMSLLNGGARAEKYVVELEYIAFDRDLTPAEVQEINSLTQSFGPQGTRLNYGEGRLHVLRQRAKKKLVHKCTLLVGMGETASQKMETDTILVEAHVRPIQADENQCQLDIQWGVAIVVNENQSTASSHTEERWVPLFKEQPISGGGIDGFRWHYVVHVRKATDADLAPKKLPKDFGDQILKKQKVRGGKNDLTSFQR